MVYPKKELCQRRENIFHKLFPKAVPLAPQSIPAHQFSIFSLEQSLGFLDDKRRGKWHSQKR